MPREFAVMKDLGDQLGPRLGLQATINGLILGCKT